jgi:hypothetical protein
MAHSIQVLDEKAETFNDLDLLVLIKFFLMELKRNSEAYPRLASIATGWRESLENYGPGTIDLRVERAVGDAEGRQQFANLLAAVARELNRDGELVPAAELNSLSAVPGVKFYDYQKSLLREAIAKLNKLLSHAGT